MKTTTFLMLFFTSVVLGQNCNLICNKGFDSVNVAGSTTAIVSATAVPCWQTTSSDNKIEVWANGYNGINSYSGSQFIEVNATQPCTVYQDFTSSAGSVLTIGFAHRARGNSSTIDSINLSVGPVGGPYTNLGTFGDGYSSWNHRTLNYTVPSGVGNSFRLRFTSVYVGFGNSAIGNFLDAVSICSSAVGIKELSADKIDVLVYPNPSSYKVSFEFQKQEISGKYVKITLMDMSGRQVALLERESSTGNIEISLDGIEEGLYLYSGMVDDKIFSGKLSVIKN